jgi:hypothetical protein
MQLKIIILIIGLTLLSGVADAQGFVHASSMWEGKKLIWTEWVKSAGGFAVGIGTYWLVVRYMKELGILAPEVQTIFWFTITIIGVAAVSGKFFQWRLIDQGVAVITLTGIAWLLFRVGD